MSYELKSARYLARDALLRAVQPGDTVVDATMGNGHDTLFLAEQVGAEGRVYAFDIQESALESTRQLLEEHGMSGRVTLQCRSHAEMAGAVPSGLAAAVFNLGWLPGAVHAVTTRTETTLRAVEAALSLLNPQGLLTVCVYPGHDEGMRELNALTKWASHLDPRRFDALLKCYMNQPNHPPQLIAVKKK